MEAHLRDIVPTHVNEEVAVFRGCTTSELVVMIGVAAAVWIPLTVAIGLMVGQFFMVFGASMLLILLSVFAMTLALQAIKVGKPDGFYQQKIALFMAKIGLANKVHFQHDGPLGIERSDCIVFLERDFGERARAQRRGHEPNN